MSKLLEAVIEKDEKFQNLTAAVANLSGALAFTDISDKVLILSNNLVTRMFDYRIADKALTTIIKDELLKDEVQDEQE